MRAWPGKGIRFSCDIAQQRYGEFVEYWRTELWIRHDKKICPYPGHIFFVSRGRWQLVGGQNVVAVGTKGFSGAAVP